MYQDKEPAESYLPKKTSELDVFLKGTAVKEANLSNMKAGWTSQYLIQPRRGRRRSRRNSRRKKTKMKRRKGKMKTKVLLVAQ